MHRRKTAIFFLILGISLSGLAVALNIGWIILNMRQVALMVLGIVFFALIITGLILNTVFLVREIRRNEQHDALLNSVTHELKTPIASIKLYLETLKSRPVEEAKRREFYDIMLADSDRLMGTVDQILQASRTRDYVQLNLGEHDLATLLHETIGIVRARHNLDPAAIRLSVPPEPVRVLGDRDQLQTAFANLLDNAVKYAGGEPKILIRLRPSVIGMTDIYFKDTGIGIEPSDLKRIFKRFYRAPTDARLTVKGTGLGLAIVRSIIKKHGGKVTAESKGENRGTTFIVKLPTV